MPRSKKPSKPPPEITLEAYLEWRAVRRGATNPERQTNPVWAWLIQTRRSAYGAGALFPGAPPMDEGTRWCFDRFGQSTTELPDGRTVLIAGEHEDYYDPDFAIYNDVVVRHADGQVEIFGYPLADFPPTDFHSATLVGDRIVILGNLGYKEQRQVGRTQVLALDLSTFAVTPIVTSGSPPGWLHSHAATLSEDGGAIVVTGGLLDGDPQTLIANIDDWQLELGTWRWHRLTERRWQRWYLCRADGRLHDLDDIAMVAWTRALWRSSERLRDDLRKDIEKLTHKLGRPPDLDLWDSVARPSISHEVLPRPDLEHSVRCVLIEGLVVRFALDMKGLQVTIEGELDRAMAATIVEETVEKLSKLDQSKWIARPIVAPVA